MNQYPDVQKVLTENPLIDEIVYECQQILKGIIVKDIQGNERAKGKTANLWRYRALAGGFFIFKHEYVMIFQKA